MRMTNHEGRITNDGVRRPFVIRHSSFVLFLVALMGTAQAADDTPLLERAPFDQVILNEANENARLEVVPLQLPRRPPGNLPQQGKLAVQLLDRPTQTFEVDWAAVTRIRVFEEMLFDEAQRLTKAGRFDDAYDYFARLSNDYPNYPGLDDAVGDYLRRNAFALYQAKQNDRALALLLTLHERNPLYPGLSNAVETVAGEVITQYLRNQQFAAARAVLDLWQIQFKGVAPDAVAAWQKRFETAAQRKMDEARNLLVARQYIPARKAAEGALAIWPELKPATDLLVQIQREFPFVTVAVFETAPRDPVRRIDDWAALRTSRLVGRALAEEIDFGSEGGIYQSPFGEWEADDSGLMLTLKLATPAHFTADQLARYFLQLVEPSDKQYRSDLSNLLSGVSLSPSGELELHWHRPHVRPEALLQFPPPSGAGATAAAPFTLADYSADQVVFTAAAGNGTNTASGLQAVIERRMATDEAAVNALLAGDVDVLDRVPPWKLDQLRAARDVKVQEYRLPTVHVLVPNMKNPLVAKREFRRALCFGIDRKWIVDRVILGGTKRPGFEVVSSPFPTGTSLSDPIRYANNSQIVARPFEPRLAAILAEVAWSSVQTDLQKEKEKNETGKLSDASANKAESLKVKKPDAEPPSAPLPELVLAHSADPIARLACQTIKLQLEREGIAIKLREFTANELLADKVEYDLRYAELAVWEPVNDARLIMGPGGLVSGVDSAYLNAALRRLDQAGNWSAVRARLAEIHEIAHHELPIIPLWQTVNSFAYRARLDGIGQAPLTLYQNVEAWQISIGGNIARADSN